MPQRYTLIVGTKQWSSWSLRAWLSMRATGAEFREITVRLRRPETRAEIRRLAPADKVPVLRIEEAGAPVTVFDSLAICETLAERHTDAQLWPADFAARAEARSISAAMHSGFAVLRESLSMEFARSFPTPALSPDVEAEIAMIQNFWREALDKYGGNGGFLFGRFSIADCMYAPVVSRFRTYGIALDPVVDAYCDRIWALPAMQDWLVAAKTELESGLC
ncbi:MAG TPA: glutathione S-transferase family protein [Rhizomicrobium sp.]|nr:glutathione S-transferase family protein [Rhizomicrobium sp.]